MGWDNLVYYQSNGREAADIFEIGLKKQSCPPGYAPVRRDRTFFSLYPEFRFTRKQRFLKVLSTRPLVRGQHRVNILQRNINYGIRVVRRLCTH